MTDTITEMIDKLERLDAWAAAHDEHADVVAYHAVVVAVCDLEERLADAIPATAAEAVIKIGLVEKFRNEGRDLGPLEERVVISLAPFLERLAAEEGSAADHH